MRLRNGETHPGSEYQNDPYSGTRRMPDGGTTFVDPIESSARHLRTLFSGQRCVLRGRVGWQAGRHTQPASCQAGCGKDAVFAMGEIVTTVSPAITASPIEVVIWVKSGVTASDRDAALAQI